MDIDKHEKIEELMASDLDHWLCNLYFEVVKLPRYSSFNCEGGGYRRLNFLCVLCSVRCDVWGCDVCVCLRERESVCMCVCVRMCMTV